MPAQSAEQNEISHPTHTKQSHQAIGLACIHFSRKLPMHQAADRNLLVHFHHLPLGAYTCPRSSLQAWRLRARGKALRGYHPYSVLCQ